MHSRQRVLMWLTLLTSGALITEWVWQHTQDFGLVERVLSGVIVLSIVIWRPVGGWLIEWLARDREPSVEFGPGDAWFERALQIWLFPLGLALIAEPVAGSLSAERPEAVTFAAMAAGILVWVMAVLEPRAKLRQAHDQLPRSHRVLGRPLTAMVLGYAGGAILVAVPTYISNVVHDVAWTYLNSSLVVVAAFLGSLLSLTRREATMPDSFTMKRETGSVSNDS